MKTVVLWLVVFLLTVTPALAVKGPQNVSRTIHNLSSVPNTEGWDTVTGIFGYEAYATDEDEVCIFCHTPHGGRLEGPLWNRALGPNNAFTHYDSSTLTAAAANQSRVVQPESLFCLSCHDGSVAVDRATNRVLNPSNDIGQPMNLGVGDRSVEVPIQMFLPSRIGQNLNTFNMEGDLADDHPISFSYTAAEGDANETGLHPVATAEGNGVRFFGASKYVECSSCHDPHVAYETSLYPSADPDYKPFLITPNTGSDLCLACHNK